MLTARAEESIVVLVMDRSDEDSKLITSLLEKSGFHVIQTASRPDALDLCRTKNDLVQLVIVNTATAGIHISELLADVQSIDPRLRVLLISDRNESKPIQNLPAAANVRGHLSRPFRRAQFLGSVLEAAKGPLVRTA